jgi:hypothetical protein
VKVKEIKGERGNTVRVMQPESDDDVKALAEEQQAGGFDDRESFADDPKAWEVKRA